MRLSPLFLLALSSAGPMAVLAAPVPVQLAGHTHLNNKSIIVAGSPVIMRRGGIWDWLARLLPGADNAANAIDDAARVATDAAKLAADDAARVAAAADDAARVAAAADDAARVAAAADDAARVAAAADDAAKVAAADDAAKVAADDAARVAADDAARVAADDALNVIDDVSPNTHQVTNQVLADAPLVPGNAAGGNVAEVGTSASRVTPSAPPSEDVRLVLNHAKDSSVAGNLVKGGAPEAGLVKDARISLTKGDLAAVTLAAGGVGAVIAD